jgi:miniconductance mechanosensitive channel
MIQQFSEDIIQWLIEAGMQHQTAILIRMLLCLLTVFLLSYIADRLVKGLFIKILARFVKKSKTLWDDVLLERKFFSRLAHFAPALVVFYTIHWVFDGYPVLVSIVQGATRVYMIFVGMQVIDAFLNAVHDIYLTLPVSRSRPIKGYVQITKVIFYFIGTILIFSVILNKNPGYFLGGLGAFAAILLLVFKDTILGLVAGIQLSANDMVRPGDWISMPGYNADGTVSDISLNTVKVQNWDKTISTIPTYALVSNSFTNWRGMEESGGRRIKRAINIDMKSVRFCDDEMVQKFKKIQILQEYIDFKLEELAKYNKENGIDETVKVNGRRMTNIGVFRKYVEAYLKKHPKIHNDMTFLVRQLNPSEKGIPLEIYVFSNDQQWANYESIQADIFDHLLAVIPEFNLRVFQNPTGDDFRQLAR